LNDFPLMLSADSDGGGIIKTNDGVETTPTARASRAGCLWVIAGGLGCAAIVLLIPLVLVIFGVSTFGGLLNGIGSVIGVGASMPAVASITTTDTIVQGIQPLGQLVSVSTQLAKADIFVGIGQGVLNACGFGANHVAQGSVEAGIDLTQLGEGDLAFDPESERYVLIVPAPQLTSCRIDYIRQYDRTTTSCSVDWDEARLLANYIAMTEFRDDAVEGGVLDRAEQEARLVLENFIGIVTGEEVEVVFRPAAEAVVPASCSPESPAGWRFNAQNGNWEK